MANTDYRYATTQLYQSGGTANSEIDEYPFTNVNFTQQLSSIGVFKGELLISGMSIAELNFSGLVAGYCALYVMKGTSVVWGGMITNRNWDTKTQLLTITAREMINYYEYRRIYNFSTSSYYNANAGGTGIGGLVYTNVDALVIVKDLLAAANAKTPNGNIGVTWASSNPSTVSGGSSVTRTFFDFEVKTVYQAILDLARGTTYFDFAIKQRMVAGLIINELIVGTPVLGVTYDATQPSSINFVFPGNIVDYTFDEDASNVGNFLYGIGYGANQNRIISKYYDNSKISGANTWPLLENSVNFIDVVSSALLANFTKGKLSAVSNPPTVIQIVVKADIDPIYNPNTAGYYSLGDQVKIVIVDSRFPTGVYGTYRIIAIDVSPGEGNLPDDITLTLNLPLATTLVVG